MSKPPEIKYSFRDERRRNSVFTINKQKFNFSERIGQGNAGSVRLYEAENGMCLAVKRYAPNTEYSKKQSFEHEYHILRKIYPQQNIHYVEYGTEKRIIMPYFKAEPLSKIPEGNIPKRKRILLKALHDVLNIFRTKGILHLDLHADNILVSSSPEKIIIIDWGMAYDCNGTKSLPPEIIFVSLISSYTVLIGNAGRLNMSGFNETLRSRGEASLIYINKFLMFYEYCIEAISQRPFNSNISYVSGYDSSSGDESVEDWDSSDSDFKFV